MKRQMFTIWATALILIGWMLSAAPAASAASVEAVPKLDLNQFMGSWYEIARYPTKLEKQCVSDGRVLYALGNKARSFQLGMFCKIKGGASDERDENGKMDKNGDGKLKVTRIWPFSSKYWVLAIGPGYQWAVVGSPNHRSLWVLSRTAVLDPAVLSSVEANASAQGFNTSKLIAVPQRK